MQPNQGTFGAQSTLQPDPPEIVSVNSRGGTSSNIAAKVGFVVLIFALVMIGGLVALNKWRATRKATDVQTEQAGKVENKGAQVGVRRTFDPDVPPPPPSASAATSLASATAQATRCPDGSPSTALIGPDGGIVPAPGGGTVRVCRDGKVLVPAIDPRAGSSATTSGSTGAPPPIGVRSNAGTGTGAGQGTAPASRFSGDVMVVSGSSGGSSGQTPASPITNPMQTMQLIQDYLGKNQGGAAPPTAGMPLTGAMSMLGGGGGAAGGGGGGTGGASPAGSIGSLLTPSQTPMVQAAMLGDRSLLLPKGRTVDCSLSTRVVSDLAGMATCVLTSNVYSDNGRVVLLERGSEAVGEYGATVTQGQRRLFVLWTRVKTPSGVVINLNSPAADALGTSGLEGYVDNHWWERIGAAFMLSLVQDAIAYKTAEATGGNNGAQGTAVFQNSSQTGDRLAEKVLDSTINIKPTIYKNQGDRATIFVARDLDFGTVYALRAR